MLVGFLGRQGILLGTVFMAVSEIECFVLLLWVCGCFTYLGGVIVVRHSDGDLNARSEV